LGQGYELIQRVAQIMSDRLLATRLRLLDLYGGRGPATNDLADERTASIRQPA
jgi:hypothetical protein